MNIELKPCPFCGEYPSVDEYATIGGRVELVRIECPHIAHTVEIIGSPEFASKEWNTRAERTCRIVKKWSDSDFVDGWRYRCSECMCFIPVNERDPETGDVISAANFCPNCGAKVVE